MDRICPASLPMRNVNCARVCVCVTRHKSSFSSNRDNYARNCEKERWSRKKLRESLEIYIACHRQEKFGESNIKGRYFCADYNRLSVGEISLRCATREGENRRENERKNNMHCIYVRRSVSLLIFPQRMQRCAASKCILTHGRTG